MPAASAAHGRSAASRSARAKPQVRWDRLGRFALLFVLVALLYLYLSAGLHMYSTWSEARDARRALTMFGGR